MKWKEVKVKFESKEALIAEDLISSIFYEFNTQGVVIEQPNEELKLKSDSTLIDEEWGEDSVERSVHHSVTGYFPDNEFFESRYSSFKIKLDQLKDIIDTNIKLSSQTKDIDEEDWAHSWKVFFKAVRITRRIVIKPTWQEYKSEHNDIVIEIDPGMAFGTGTHQTTALCIKMIERYMRSGDSFLDIGTGSGILSIVAAKYGACEITGVDIDEIAVNITKKNLHLNNVKQKCSIKMGTIDEVIGKKFDFVVANITSEILVSCLSKIKTVLKNGSTLILSGIISRNLNEVQKEIKKLGIVIVDISIEDEWVAIVCCNVETADTIFNW